MTAIFRKKSIRSDNPIENISKAMINGNIDNQWKLDLESVSEIFKASTFNAIYHNPKRQSSISLSGENWRNQFRIYSSQFTAKVKNQIIELNDHNGAAKGVPDGKLSPFDRIHFKDTSTSYYFSPKDLLQNEWSLGFFKGPNNSIHFGLTGRLHGALIPEDQQVYQFTDDRFKNFSSGKYHGLEFKRNGNNWIFHGPAERAVEGKQLEQILEELQQKYAAELKEAQEHLR